MGLNLKINEEPKLFCKNRERLFQTLQQFPLKKTQCFGNKKLLKDIISPENMLQAYFEDKKKSYVIVKKSK